VSRAIYGIGCVFLGAVIFIGLGGFAYVLLDVMYGARGNTEGTATQAQQYYSSIAAPVGWSIAGGGVFLSLLFAFLTLPKE
jgi:hypothetical protein